MDQPLKHYIAHLDLDCFFVSVERIKNPALIGKPVVIGGSPDGRGVVTSASYEARKFGVRSAMPTGQALKLCPALIVVRGSHGSYSEYSRKIYSRLCELVPVVEQSSIDEMYLDLTGCERLYGDLFRFVATLQLVVRDEYNLPCTIALASNRTVAKIATDTVKPQGLCYVEHGKEKEFLAPLPVGAIPGVGAKTEQLLKEHGFRLIKDLQAVSEDSLVNLLGKHGSWLHRVSQGAGRDVLAIEHVRKSISQAETFGSDTRDHQLLLKILFSQVESVCSTLRKRKWKTRTVTLKLRDSGFKTITRSKTIEPTDHDPDVFAAVKELFNHNYRGDKPLRLVGVHITNFTDASPPDLPLFPSEDKKKEMLTAVDALRRKFGKKVIRIGGI
ncbi:MAG: DNA polymerase IV [Ignavibacteria bacterium]|nr:DNA polymerase IV [Ignavibacteria bacterium]